jgi:hypothetical protein
MQNCSFQKMFHVQNLVWYKCGGEGGDQIVHNQVSNAFIHTLSLTLISET